MKRLPSLWTVNGFGTGVYGRRDVDPETQTYVKTYCLCAAFIPLFALGAYRVADAGVRRWSFLGREPMSNFARGWNYSVVSLILGLMLYGGWNAYTSSPDYQARQTLKQAAKLLAKGEALPAARIYRRQLGGLFGDETRTGLKNALDACLQANEPATVAGALYLVAGLPPSANRPSPLETDVFKRGLGLVEKFRAQTPVAGLEVLQATAALDPTNAVVLPLEIDLLKQVIAANPNDTNHVVELAVIYEKNQDLKNSYQLLRPYQDRLGSTEGARILGTQLLAEQNFSAAYGLLFPYVQVRLDRLRNIENAYSNAEVMVSRRAISDLRDGHAGEDFYQRYDAAAKSQREEMVDTFIQSRMKTDPTYLRALMDLKEANRIVPVALDLGIVQVNRAQALAEPTARKAELEAAEKTFLAIRGFAGESDEYRLFLGQVYYWLGKSREGHVLFDQLLASAKRNYSILMAISETLRQVGERTEASKLVEEAYRTAQQDKERYSAAAMRAVLSQTVEERITWLQKCDPNEPGTQVELNDARGQVALRQSNKTLAASLLNQAVQGYSTQAKTVANLNNWALACFDLYEATGDVAQQKHGMSLFEEAVAMDPRNSILLHNVTHFLINQAVADVNQDVIHFSAISESADLEALPCLYQDEASRAKVYEPLRASETMKQVLAYLDKDLLLEPKDANLYSTALALYGGFRDLPALQKLQQRWQVAAPDLGESQKEALDIFAGTKDQEYQDKLQNHIRSLTETARSLAAKGDGRTLEYVNISLINSQLVLWSYGGQVDSLKLLQTAQATDQKRRSAASIYTLQAAYFFRASEELAGQNPDYAHLVKLTRHCLSPEYLIAFILERGGPLANLAQKNANVIAGLGLEKDMLASFPLSVSLREWALLRQTNPTAAAQAARLIQENQTARLIDTLENQFRPWSAGDQLEQYWTLKLQGQDQHATETYQAALHNGVPLPPL